METEKVHVLCNDASPYDTAEPRTRSKTWLRPPIPERGPSATDSEMEDPTPSGTEPPKKRGHREGHRRTPSEVWAPSHRKKRSLGGTQKEVRFLLTPEPSP